MESKELEKINIMLVMGNYSKALKLVLEYIEDNYDDINGYILKVKILSKNYTKLDIENINEEIDGITKLAKYKKTKILDQEYIKYANKIKNKNKVVLNNKEELKKNNLKNDAKRKEKQELNASLAKAIELVNNKKYSEAKTIYLKLGIDKLDNNHKYYLGLCYEFEKDYDNAVKYFQESAEGGNIFAENAYGNCYKSGKGVDRNIDLAVVWYEKSANRGCADALYNLSNCYLFGFGVKKDKVKAKELLEKAAKQGHADAIKKLKTIK